MISADEANQGTPDLQEALMAHQLIHGLSALSGTIESAIEITASPMDSLDEEDWRELREHLEAIRHEIDSQVFSAFTLLSYRSPELASGIQRPIIRCVRPTDLLSQMLPSYEARAALRGIAIAMDSEAFDRMPRIEIENNIMRRVFHNILVNAVKYSYRGFKSQRFIRIWCRRHETHGRLWALAFQNYGVGILPDEKKQIFEPGYRGALARKESIFGSGLGLADVQKCMNLHGGYAEIESKPQDGGAFVTTLTLIFPEISTIRRHFPDVVPSVG